MNTSVIEKSKRVILNEDNKVFYITKKIERPKGKELYLFFKRVFDILFSIIASVFMLIPCLVIAVAIKCDSKGPVLYRQERVGHNGKRFLLYKFRSMRVDAESEGAKWASNNDDRCTRVGRVLRKFRLDELPQLPFNVLPGSLSIVGPRPERQYFYDEFATYIDGFDQRLYVKPGLTGFAQVNGGYDLKPQEKIVFDLEYIEKMSFGFDLKILLKTVLVVFSNEGAR